MCGCEGILKVEDGEQETHELPQRQHQGDDQGGAFRCQGEHSSDTNVSVEPELMEVAFPVWCHLIKCVHHGLWQ